MLLRRLQVDRILQQRRRIDPVLYRLQHSKAVAVQEIEGETITFPRETAGLSYALNWALAAKAIPPQGDVFRNLETEELKKHGASPQEASSGSKIFARGSYSTGASEITKAQFNKVFKEVTQYLSSSYKLFVHDGAVGSSPKCSVKLRSISDNPSATLYLSNILCPTSVDEISHEAYPLCVYVASGLRPKALDSLLDTAGSYVAADYDRSALVVGGKVFADLTVLKSALAAFASPAILARGALPLNARLITVGDSAVIVVAPEKTQAALREASVFNDVGIIWTDEVVSGFLKQSSHGSKPKAFLIVTRDSTGAVPEISKLSPGQAAFHYLAGYDGEKFVPGYGTGLSSISPLSIAKQLLSTLSNNGVAPYLVNTNGISDKDLLKLLDAAAKGQLPKIKKPSEDSVKALKAKYVEFVSKTFPDLPETITCD